MRFSSVFQLHAAPQQPAATGEAVPVEAAKEDPVPPVPGPELPDDLDARVRLIGEWQLGEGY